MKLLIQSKQQVEDKIRVTVAVMNGNTEVFGRNFEGRTAEEINRSLANFQAILDMLPAELAKIEEGEFTPPTPVPTPDPVEPTVEELKAQAIAQAEMELDAEIERAKKERERAQLALEDTQVAEKLTALDVLKTSKDGNR
jgi:hypothetical protein